MTPDEEVEGLTRWASRSHAAERGRLLLALANVVASDDLSRRPRAQACLDAILPALALDADPETRAELTARLADAPWAPAPLLAELADGPPEVARPLLARSPCLDEASLSRALERGEPEVQLAVARRGVLPPSVIDRLLDRADPDALSALAANPHARFSEDQMSRLVACARRTPALRLPLTRRPELTVETAAALAPSLSEPLRRALTQRFGLVQPGACADPEAEARLVEKLSGSGRLTQGFAVRALREGKQSLFVHALAALGGQSPDAVRAALASGDRAELERVCAAAGIDRSAVADLARSLGEQPAPEDGPAQA